MDVYSTYRHFPSSITTILTLGLGFLPHELHIFYIRGTRTMLFWTVATKKGHVNTFLGVFPHI
jgi:hypothetical protein